MSITTRSAIGACACKGSGHNVNFRLEIDTRRHLVEWWLVIVVLYCNFALRFILTFGEEPALNPPIARQTICVGCELGTRIWRQYPSVITYSASKIMGLRRTCR